MLALASPPRTPLTWELSRITDAIEWPSCDGRIVADEKLHDLKSRAPREVSLVFASDEAATEVTPPNYLLSATKQGRAVNGELLGDAAELVRWAAQQDIVDISIGRPNLESLFHQYYESD